MTNPGGASPETYLLDGWDGVLFGASSGGISGLQDLTQAAVMAAKQALIEGNEVLSFVLGLIFEGLRNGIPLALAIIEGIIVKLFGLIPGFTSIEDALNAIGEVPFIADIVQAMTGTVGGTLADIEAWAASLGSDVSGAAAKLAALISAVGGTVIGDVSDAINAANEDIAELIDGVGGLVIDDVVGKIILIQQIIDGIANALGHPGTGHSIAQLITYVGNIPGDVVSGVTRDWSSALAALQLPNPLALVQQIPQSIPAVVIDAEGAITTVGNGFTQDAEGAITFVSDGLTHLVQQADGAILSLQQIAAQIVHATSVIGSAPGNGVAGAVKNPGVADVMNAGQTAHTAFVGAIEQAGVTDGNDIIAGANALGGVVSGSASQIEDAAVNVFGGVGAAAGQLGQSVEAFFGGLFGAWTNGSPAATNASAVNQAAAAARADADYQVKQTNAINALTPHFYGGTGTSGLPLQSVTFSGTLPASFTSAASIATNSAVYNVAAASTDQETVSAFWNTPLSAAPGSNSAARYLFLRSNTALTTYLYLKHYLEVTVANEGIVHVEIGCVVAGIPHVLDTASVTSASAFWASVVFGPQSWALEATGNAVTLIGPGGYSFSTIDGSPGGSPVVSQIGSLYRSAGIGSDETSWLSKITDWNFYDSGPTAGPAAAFVATPETSTSTSYVDLATTTDQVTVTIGASGLAILNLSATLDSATTDGTIAMFSFVMSGANTQAASDAMCGGFSNRDIPGAGSFLLTGLTPGSTTFKMKYRVTGGTFGFSDRRISVIPL